jgi:hypothetical protein
MDLRSISKKSNASIQREAELSFEVQGVSKDFADIWSIVRRTLLYLLHLDRSAIQLRRKQGHHMNGIHVIIIDGST